MGVETGVDLERLIAASRSVQELLGRPLGAHVLTAGPVEWARAINDPSPTPDSRSYLMAKRTAIDATLQA